MPRQDARMADCRVVSYDVPCLTVYNPAYASFAAGGNCGMDSNRFAQELDAQKVPNGAPPDLTSAHGLNLWCLRLRPDTQYTEALQYSKANYATEPALANVDQISNVLFGKRVRNGFCVGVAQPQLLNEPFRSPPVHPRRLRSPW